MHCVRRLFAPVGDLGCLLKNQSTEREGCGSLLQEAVPEPRLNRPLSAQFSARVVQMNLSVPSVVLDSWDERLSFRRWLQNEISGQIS